ncbi:MAG: hypothetical protein Rubg2KO_08610 [Rubricoccaceae bacterium]
MRILFCLLLLVAVAACDTTPLAGGDTPFVYATDGTDRAIDLVQAPSGDLIVVGSTEGKPRPADGTLALPSVLRFGLDGELLSAEVYRDVDYGDVEAAAWGRDGLVLALSAGPDGEGDRTNGVYRANERGQRKATLLGFDDGYLPRRALVASPGGQVTAAVYASSTDPQIYRLRSDGDVLWTARLGGSQDVRGLAEAPGGDVYVVGPGDATTEGWIVARLDGTTGAERWRHALQDGVEAMAATPNGLALLTARYVDDEGREVRVVRLNALGGEESVQVVSAPQDGQRGAALTALSGGRLAVGLRTWNGWDTPPEASVLVLANDGSEQSRERFGVEGRWVELAAIELLADGRIAVAGAVGPERVSGYGGDDFDVWVSLYDLD